MNRILKIFLIMTAIVLVQCRPCFADPISAFLGTQIIVNLGLISWGTTIGGLILTGMTAVAIGYSIYKSFQTDRIKTPESKYTASEITNTFSNEGIVPIIYGGPIIVGGNIIWQSDPGTTVQRFIALCIGEISAITNVCVDEQDIAGLSGCSYTAYTGTSAQAPDSRAGGAVKGLKDVAYLALTITSGDKVSGNPVVSCYVTGRKIKTWNTGTESWDTNAVAASSNNAAVIRDYLLLSSTLGGAGLSESYIDNDSFGAVSEYCDVLVDNGSGGTEKRFNIDIVLDTEHSVLDNLSKMLITFNGRIIRSGNKYKLVCEQSGQSAAVAFTEDNIVRDSFSFGYGSSEDTPNKVGVEWISALEFRNPKRTEYFEDEGDQALRGKRAESIPSVGIIRQTQASRLAKKVYYERKLGDMWCEFTSSIQGISVEPYDVISVTHSRPAWTAGLFLVIDCEEVNYGVSKFRCKSYNSSLLDDRHATRYFDTWDYGSPPNPFAPVADVTGISLSEIGWRNADGVHIAHIDISWIAPATNKQLLDSYIIELSKDAGTYIPIGSAAPSATEYRVNINLAVGSSYTVKIKTRNREGIISDGATSSSLDLIGKDALPSNVSAFIVKKYRDKIVCKWTLVTDVDVIKYNIRKGNNWASGDSVGAGLTGDNATLNDIKTGTDQSYWIKAEDNSGNESANAKEALVTVDNIPFQNIIDTNEEHPAWGGTKVDTETSGNNLIISADHLTGTYTTPAYDIGYISEARIIIDSIVAATTALAWNSDAGAKFNDSATLRFTGESAPGALTFQIKTSEDNVTWSAFEDWILADYKCRYYQIKMTATRASLSTVLTISNLTVKADLPDIDETQDYEITVAANGAAITFAKTYHEAPAVNVDILSGDGIVHIFSVVPTTTGCTIKHLALDGSAKTGTGKVHVHGI